MKATALIPAIALALGTVFTALPSAAEARGPARNNQTQTSAFTAEDAQTLTWMREEEKLARDVYINLYQQWNKAIFDNIAASEQRHIDAIASLMVRFDVPDPSLPGVGEFSNPEIQSMYDDLLEQGSLSLTEAFWVGATIEDVDIYDLQIAIENTEVGTLKTTYGNLLEGSKNHLRAFVRQLEGVGVTYEPQFIDPVLYDAIINGG
ncbi:MAG: DUF2202 domain-containing protein [Lysobacteraceae bacterium]|nr:DUF2202 domain-containing protein [Xanthomonadales bacterium]HPF72991.1 DUF2202 domain-containing protein [Xanthomonadaceae bacterium]HRX99493.1 DUF2202 domain-containing protein [Xanthomonadaceae bacterium]